MKLALSLLVLSLSTVALADEVYNCVSSLKTYQNFNNDQAAQACRGAH